MKHGSLFSGIGGFDYAAQLMGWNNVFHCEWIESKRKFLENKFKGSISYGDISKTDFTIHRGTIDILTGGFPCQPYSSSGNRLGKEDERHLWPEMLRAIREIQPRYIVGENVRGLTNWNGGLVFDEVQSDLEAQGFEVLPFLLPACAINAPHQRDRIWFVAHTKRIRWNTQQQELSQSRRNLGISSKSYGIGCWNSFWSKWKTSKANRNSQAQSPICFTDDGLPRELDGITIQEWIEQSVKAAGNAIVPQVALQIFKAIQETD